MLTNHDDHHCKRHGYPQGMHERIMRIGGAVAICQKTRTPTMHPSKEEISTELKKILVEDLFVEIPTEKMKDTDSLSTDIGLDSVGQIELVSIIKERYGIKVDAQEAAADMTTIASTVHYVWKNDRAGGDYVLSGVHPD